MSATPPLAVEAFAPGSIGNIGPGLDVLGCAVTGAGDRVIARCMAGDAIVLEDPGHPALPTDPARHACAIAADAVRRACGMPRAGVALRVLKGLPLSAGQGGSAASAVAAAVAVHVLLGEPLDQMTLLACALEAESVVAGRHLDNLAPSLMGGVVTVLGTDPCDAARVPVRQAPWFALAHPHITVHTADARAVLPQFLPRATAIAQLASVSAMVTAFASGDLALLGRSLVDHIAEPARAPRVPGFADALRAAREAGAVGGSFSGSGPTTFAVCATEAIAAQAAAAMQSAYQAAGVACDTRVVTIDEAGARWRPVDPAFPFHDATGVPA
jgi:homoserine kinase